MFEQTKFCKRLAECLDDLSSNGISAKKLSTEIHVDNRSISNYRHGQNLPPIPTLVAIAEKCGVSVDYLLGLVDEPAANIETREICNKTRLSSAALANLSQIFDADIIADVPNCWFSLNDDYAKIFNGHDITVSFLENDYLKHLIGLACTYCSHRVFEKGMESLKGTSTTALIANWTKELTQQQRANISKLLTGCFIALIDSIADNYMSSTGLNTEEKWIDFAEKKEQLKRFDDLIAHENSENESQNLQEALAHFLEMDFNTSQWRSTKEWQTYRSAETKPEN